MKPEIKDKWLESLRSGEYQQGKEFLMVDDGSDQRFCCLGVLCDLYQKEHPEIQWEKTSYRALTLLGKGRVLPLSVIEWADLDGDSPDVRMDGLHQNLATLNDNGLAFSEIAELIEEQL